MTISETTGAADPDVVPITLTEPRPSTLRWQPLRVGLVNLFHYENEEFPFRDGRLLFRGNNGAGKSKVLALTLPFLFDGDVSARRIEPDADPGKRMEWNLLMGGEYPHTERVGYSWLELGRLDEDGVEHFVTIGAGLKAARGQTGTKSWFFVTPKRIGRDLSLVDGTRTPLSFDRLDSALDGDGHAYKTKAEYRRAVDEKLFGLGERRYSALMDLLIQIRAPQLSKRPSEKLLSDALTESLTPLSRDLITTVADGLRGLDEDREELQEFVDAHKGATAFLGHYAAYAQVLLKRRARLPRENQAEHDRVGRSIVELTANAAAAERTLRAKDAELEGLAVAIATTEAEQDALRDSEYVELEAQLKATDSAASVAEARRLRALADSERAAAELVRATNARDEQQSRVDRDWTAQAEARGLAESAAMDAGIAHAGETDFDTPTVTPAIASARAALSRVSELLAAVHVAEIALASARQRLDSADAACGIAATNRQLAQEALEAAATTHVSDVERYLATLVELSVDDDAFENFANWAHSAPGDNPVTAALSAAASAAVEALSTSRADASARLRGLTAELDVVDSRIVLLERGETVAPPAHHGRDHHGSVLAGAVELWRAVSFRETVTDRDRSGFEAALEASGLLTGLIDPAGDLHDAVSGRVLLVADGPSGGGPSLTDYLQVDLPAGAAVDAATVESILSSIRVADDPADSAPVWVSATGRFRLGVAHGAWSKPTAAYIGESARANARAEQLESARAERATLAIASEQAAAQIDLLSGRIAAVGVEQRGVPSALELEGARRADTRAADLLAHSETTRENIRADVDALVLDLERRTDELAVDARALDLPADAESIAERSTALGKFESRVTLYWHARSTLADAVRVLDDAAANLLDREGASERASGELRDGTLDAEATAAASGALRSRVGEDVVQYRNRVAEVAATLTRFRSEVASTYRQKSAAEKDVVLTAERLRENREKQAAIAEERVASVDLLRRSVGLGLLTVALPSLDQPDPSIEWTVTQGVLTARAIDAALPELDASDSRFERLQTQLHSEFTALQQALGRHGHQPALNSKEGGLQVLVVFAGKQTTLPALAEMLASDIEARRELLGAKEREIIQNHLVDEVGATLSELVGDAERQILDVNSELEKKLTSTGMKLRVRWKQRADGPAGLAEARARLATISDAWDEGDRKALGDFLQARIAEVRESDESGNWYDHLGEALDYRRWHHFVVDRYQGGAWKPATGPASGGERVLSASIPLFAAASSHYRSAGNPFAPRMIMLDEAFAGVDDNARARCLGLLTAFDLDVVMTSEREWGCYAEVPGLSIAQLSRFEDTPAVLVQLWSWDGRQRSRVGQVEVPRDPDAMW